ncbi:MAG: aspartate-semialdehyde dehydrogenase [Longimicrobiales bacterium]|nr:aspartate-semialdehyde dehydrogenase [Longimicrobiales bacterium]
MSSRIPVGILGVTGLVGRRVLARLSAHPWFEVVEAGASERSVGASLDALRIRAIEESGIDPGTSRAIRGGVRALEGAWSVPLLISALPARVARETEPRLAAAGHLVVSNASAFRDDPSIPLVLPDVNPDHLDLIGREGGIVTNPNCSVATFVPPLARLHHAFGVEAVSVTTFQAVSGAGSRGPTVLELTDNLLPSIPGEEEKVECEPAKLLGWIEGGSIVSARFPVSATTTRVPVLHGHLVDVAVRLSGDPSPGEVRAALLEPATTGAAAECPTLVGAHLRVTDDDLRPQPRLDRSAEGGMAITVGRIRRCAVMGVRFVALAHNLERGAAGAAVANAELARVRERIPGVPA